jgi:uncharacterized protein (TIGR01777 family)
MNRPHIVIAGGSGFIGSALAREFLQRGHAVIVLTRTPRERRDGICEIIWDGEHPDGWTSSLDSAAAVINLAGKNINCRHTPENVRALTASRVNSVTAIAAAVARVKTPPRVWVQASATGFYGDTKERICDETAPAGDDTLAKICCAWEAAFAAAPTPATRKVIVRIGFVLGRTGGALPLLARLTGLFLGGAAGNGRQYVSWIHLADLTRMFLAAVENEKLSGTFNAVAPNAVTNAEFMRELRRALHRPWSPPAPVWAVKLGTRLMGTEASLALTSQRCAPRRFSEAGFPFQFTELSAALRDLCRKNPL